MRGGVGCDTWSASTGPGRYVCKRMGRRMVGGMPVVKKKEVMSLSPAFRVQQQCESRGGRPAASVDVKQHFSIGNSNNGNL